MLTRLNKQTASRRHVCELSVWPQLIEIGLFGKWAEFRNKSLIPACKGHVSNSVHHMLLRCNNTYQIT